MKTDNKFCVIILNYNDADETCKLALEVNKFSSINKVIIVDNASTDESLKKIDDIESDRIVIVRCKKNGGYGAGNNAGVRKAKEIGCTYAIIANPDVSFDENVVKECKEALEKNERAVIVSPVQLDINNNEIKAKAWKIPTSAVCSLRGTRLGTALYNHSCWRRKGNEKKYVKVDCVPGAFLAINVDRFINIGMYDENVFLYCEESIIGLRAKDRNYSTLLITDVFYKHEHAVSINKSIPKMYNQMKILNESRLYYMENYLHASAVYLSIARFLQNRRLRKIQRIEKG